MRIKRSSILLIVSAFVFVLVSGCSESETPTSPELNGGPIALPMGEAEIEQILTDLQQNNIESGAFFFDVSNHSFGLGIVDFSTGANGFFFGNYGDGDFLRLNPDGTFSTRLVTNQADALTFNFAGGGVYTGTGLMNYGFSGTFLSYDSNGGPVFLIAEPSLNAEVVQGLATVTLFGSGADPHRLHMNFVSNPGGQSHFKLTFDPVQEDNEDED